MKAATKPQAKPETKPPVNPETKPQTKHETKPQMKIDDMLQSLEEVAQKKAIRVTYENFGGELGAGGLCKVKGEWRLIIDKRATPSERVAMVAGALTGFPLEDVFLTPEVRDLLDKVRQARVLRDRVQV